MTPNTTQAQTPAPGASLVHRTRVGLALRRLRVGVLQARRLWSWARSSNATRPVIAPSHDEFPHCVYERTSPIMRGDPGADERLERGKAINLQIAAPHFDGLVLTPDRPLSYWRTLGRCTQARGFRHGTEVRGGCIVPTLGGGLCLLSNALFLAACDLGWTILERHGHTLEAAPPPDDVVWGLDATVFWPHVDLRVAPASGAARLEVKVRDNALIIRVHARVPLATRTRLLGVADVTYERDGMRFRANRVIRHVHDAPSGALLSRDVVASNRRRLLHTHDMRRNCLTCDESSCHARPREATLLSIRESA